MSNFKQKIKALQRVLDAKNFNCNCRWSNFENQHRMIEKICSDLLNMNQPIGGFLLAYHYKQWGMSRIDSKLNAVALANEMYERWIPRLLRKNNKSGFEHYWVGIIYSGGIRVPVSMSQAKVEFNKAFMYGCKIAWHELCWIEILRSASPDFWNPSQFLKKYSLAWRESMSSYKATSKLSHLFKVDFLEIEDLIGIKDSMKEEMFSDIGKRHMNIIVEKI